MNILQQEDALKNYSKDQLVQEMQGPSGQFPQFLVLTELKRRQRVEQDYQRAQNKPKTTVAEDAVSAAGIPALAARQMAGNMAPETDMAMNYSRPQEPVSQEPPPPVMGYREGGLVSRLDGGRAAPADGLTAYAFTDAQGRPRDRMGRLIGAQQEFDPIDVSDNTFAAMNSMRMPMQSDPVPPSSGMVNQIAQAPRAPAQEQAPFRLPAGLPPWMNPNGMVAGAGNTIEDLKASLALPPPVQGPSPFPTSTIPVDPRLQGGPPQPMLDEMAVRERMLDMPEFGPPVAPAVLPGTADWTTATENMPGVSPAAPVTPRNLRPELGFPGEGMPAPIDSGVPLTFGDPGTPVTPGTPPAGGGAGGGGGGAGGGGGGGGGSAQSNAQSLLAERMAAIEEDREQAKWMALAQFGLSMMSSTDPNFGRTFGDAGNAALSSYQDGIASLTDREDALKVMEIEIALAKEASAAAARAGSGAAGEKPLSLKDRMGISHDLLGRAFQLEELAMKFDTQDTEVSVDPALREHYSAQATQARQQAARLRTQANGLTPEVSAFNVMD